MSKDTKAMLKTKNPKNKIKYDFRIVHTLLAPKQMKAKKIENKKKKYTITFSPIDFMEIVKSK